MEKVLPALFVVRKAWNMDCTAPQRVRLEPEFKELEQLSDLLLTASPEGTYLVGTEPNAPHAIFVVRVRIWRAVHRAALAQQLPLPAALLSVLVHA